MKFGDVELTMLSDGPYLVDGGATFGIVPRVFWEKKLKPDELNRVTIGINCLLVRTGSHTILIDTGIGNKISAKMKQLYGFQPQLLDNMKAAGIAPADIDIVINTHLHLDHSGWNTVLDGGQPVATFPRARYFAQQGEVCEARRPLERNRGVYFPENYEPLIANGQMELITGDAEILPGLEVKVLPGHTAHMQSVFIRSNGKTACFTGDLISMSPHLELMWGMAFDLFPLDLIESRKWFYQHAIPEQWLVIFPHDPNVPWGYIQQDAQGKVTLHAEPRG